VRIDGAHQVMPVGARWPRRAKVVIRFGEPMRALPGEDARTFTRRLEEAVRKL
jgi:hypothetical protein